MVIPSKERNLLSRAVIPAPPSVIPDIFNRESSVVAFLCGSPASLQGRKRPFIGP